MQRVKKYDKSFKEEAVRLSQEPGRTQASVEQDLGLWQGAISVWKKEISIERSSGILQKDKDIKQSPTETIRALTRENERLKRERDILKKAVAIFSVDPNRYSRS